MLETLLSASGKACRSPFFKWLKTDSDNASPTLMGANSGGNIADAGWQVRVIETILVNTFQIFDDD